MVLKGKVGIKVCYMMSHWNGGRAYIIMLIRLRYQASSLLGATYKMSASLYCGDVRESISLAVSNKPGPILTRLFRRSVWLQDAGYPVILVFLSAFTTTKVTVIAVIPHLLFSLASNMRTHGCRPYQGVNKDNVLTITVDNGKELARQKISKGLKPDIYFARPYHAQERGLNENTNGLLRQYFPKQIDFRTIDDNSIQHAVERLNNRPRKTLGFATPDEVFFQRYQQQEGYRCIYCLNPLPISHPLLITFTVIVIN